MRAARAQRWLILALILGLTAGCTEDMSKPGAGQLFGQGSKDYWDRQTIEDYQRKTVPAIEEFMRRLLAASNGQHYTVDGDANDLYLCETKTGGREYRSGVFDVQASLSPAKIRAIAKETIERVGLKIERQDEERDNVTGFSWSDFENGGFLMLNAHPTKGISFNFTSGCRPSTSKNAYPPPLKGVPTASTGDAVAECGVAKHATSHWNPVLADFRLCRNFSAIGWEAGDGFVLSGGSAR